MKKIAITLLLVSLFVTSSFTQILYNWSGSNPGWTASNNDTKHITWQPSIGSVSTNAAGVGYSNSHVSTYTSGVMSFPCSSASTVSVTINLDIDLETQYDWIYFQYSTNNGTSWINPVASFSQPNLSGINLSAYGLGTNNRNGFTGYSGGTSISRTYIVPKTTNKFRFVFATDGSTNSWFGGWYYTDVTGFSVSCAAMLPVEFLSFSGENVHNTNKLLWKIASETNSDFYEIERSVDNLTWEALAQLKSTGANFYEYVDQNYKGAINYYKLSQVDLNGTRETLSIIGIDNRFSEKQVLYVCDMMGTQVPPETKGFVIVRFTDNTVEKRFNN